MSNSFLDSHLHVNSKKLLELASNCYPSSESSRLDFQRHHKFMTLARQCIQDHPISPHSRKKEDSKLLSPTISSRAKQKSKLNTSTKNNQVSTESDNSAQVFLNRLESEKKSFKSHRHAPQIEFRLSTELEQFKPQFLRILSIPPFERSRIQIDKIMLPVLKKLPALSQVPDLMIHEIGGVMTFEELPQNHIIFKQGVRIEDIHMIRKKELLGM